MAVHEACQLWIEQRIEEELSEKHDSGKSLRAIGREIAAEIERLFEAKVSTETLRKTAARQVGKSSPPTPTPEETKENVVDIVDKLTPEQAFKKMSREAENGKPLRQAAAEIGPRCGKSESAMIKFYTRERRSRKYCGDVQEAMGFAKMAISQLERIRPDDPTRQKALLRVRTWLDKNMEN